MNKTESRNFDGDWDDLCPFCNEPQRIHQINLGELEGVTYLHRQPCEEQKYKIRKKAVQQGIISRIIINIFDLCIYIYDKIPLKNEFKLFYGFLKNIYKSLRAIRYLNKTK